MLSGGHAPVHRLLTVGAPSVQGTGSGLTSLSSCSARASLPRGLWDLTQPGTGRASPALAGGFLATGPQEVPHHLLLPSATGKTCCHFFSCRVGSHPRVCFSRAVAWRLIGDPVKSPKPRLPGKKNFAGSDQACSSPWFFFFK